MRNTLIIFAVLLALLMPAGISGADQQKSNTPKPEPPKVGAQAPDFTLKDQDGKEWKLSTCKGEKTVAIAIGSIMCQCGRNALKELQVAQDKYTARGLQVVHVNTEPWMLDSDPEYLRRFAKESKITFPLLSDAGMQVSSRYSPDTMPLMCLVDTKGVVQLVLRGRPADSAKQVAEQVEKFLPQPREQNDSKAGEKPASETK